MYYYTTNDCIGCRRCAEVCVTGAVFFDGDKFSIDKEKCVGCGSCAKVCTGAAIFSSDYVAPPAPVYSDEVTKYDCDVLVIGAGPAGLVNAVREREQGRKVIILEASKLPGGAGVHATGYNVVNTKWQLDAGTPDYLDDYVRAAMTVTKNQLNYRFLRNGFAANAEFFDWFRSWCDVSKNFFLMDSPAGKEVMMDFRTPGGRFMMGKLSEKAVESGVEILYQHTAKQFLQEGNKVVAVRAESPAGPVEVTFRACLIATGNMCQAKDLADFVPEYAGVPVFRNPHRSPYATGDGVRMVRELGIPVDQKNVVPHYLGAMPCWFDGHVLKQGLRPEGLRVNTRGERFVSEGVDRFDAVDELLKQPRALSFNIVDNTTLAMDIQPTIKLTVNHNLRLSEALPLPGKPLQMVNFMGMPVQLDKDGNPVKSPMDGLEEGRGMGNYPPDSKPDPERMRHYAKTLKDNHVCVGDTLEELAEQMQVPYETLKATVDRYNEMCRKGVDEDFGKYPRYLKPIENGPFYAFKCFLSSDGVFGGIFVDEGCRVVDGKTPVTGLYAAGDLTAGNYIKENSHRVEAMNDFSWAHASGFLASKSMDADFEAGII